MRVGFEVADLYPHRGGVYTFASQLLYHLIQLEEAPDITLVDALRHRNHAQLANDVPPALRDAVSHMRYIRARHQPMVFLSSIDGSWMKSARTRRIAANVDRRVLQPWRATLHAMSPVARWCLPPDLVGMLDVCHWSDSVFVRVPGVANIATILDTIPLNHPEWYPSDQRAYQVRKMRLIARHATRIIAISEHTRRDAINLLGCDPARIDVVPGAVGEEFSRPVGRDHQDDVLLAYGLRAGQYILYCGNLKPHKNVVRLAKAFKAAVEREPGLAMALVLAGDGGTADDPVRRQLQELGLRDRLRLLGRVPQEHLPILLHGSRAFAFVSLYEGFGLPPLEAMASGTAVIASNASSVPEVVGNAGLLVDPYNVGAMAEALHRVMIDDALRANLVAQGLQQASRFSWRKTAELTLETYRRAHGSQTGQEKRIYACT